MGYGNETSKCSASKIRWRLTYPTNTLVLLALGVRGASIIWSDDEDRAALGPAKERDGLRCISSSHEFMLKMAQTHASVGYRQRNVMVSR